MSVENSKKLNNNTKIPENVTKRNILEHKTINKVD